jgi:haloalkane dehalogenase
MTDSAQPFAAKKFLEIKGRRMAYIDEGEGAPIVFAHGNPTSLPICGATSCQPVVAWVG